MKPAMKLSRNDGFSLLELMVVMLIIGLAYGAVRVLAPATSSADEAQKYALAFQFWFEKQMDHSLISGTEIGFFITEGQWHVLSWREGSDESAEPETVWEVNESLNPFSLDKSMRFEVVIDDLGNRWLELANALPEQGYLEPHVILLPSEEYFPAFEAKILPHNSLDESYEFVIAGNGYNRLKVNRNE